MNDRLEDLRTRTGQVLVTLQRLESLLGRLEDLGPGPRRDGLSEILAQALERLPTGSGAPHAVARRVPEDGGALPAEPGLGEVALAVSEPSVGFSLDRLEFLMVLCEGMLESEQDPYETHGEGAWVRDFRRLVRAEDEDACEAVPAGLVQRWRSLRDAGEELEGARRLSHEMAMTLALRALVAWALGRARVSSSASRPGLALRMGSALLEQTALA